jgi:hypothetical protein
MAAGEACLLLLSDPRHVDEVDLIIRRDDHLILR